jgi:hypothetical protein
MNGAVELTDASSAGASTIMSPKSPGRRRQQIQIPDLDDDQRSEEAMGFISSESVNHREMLYSDDDDDYLYSFGFWKLACCMCIVLVVALLALFLPSMDSFSERWVSLREPARLPVIYDCPSDDGEDNSSDNNSNNIYKETVESMSDDLDKFMDNYQNSQQTEWKKSYKQVKAGIYEFKSQYFAPYLRDGDTIFEFASGNGLNLYMTLEILKEVKGIEHLIVYGNSKDNDDKEVAKAVFDHNAPAHGRTGIFCSEKNMTRMEFIPSDSFNLVFTTGITPDDDPLNFGATTSADKYRQYYKDLCEAKGDDWKGKALNNMAQSIQMDRFGEWVAEMSRIARPGAPIVVERISSSKYCADYEDWGGVEQSWWTNAASSNQYRWNVDPDSLEVVEDGLISAGSYNIFMRKKNKK